MSRPHQWEPFLVLLERNNSRGKVFAVLPAEIIVDRLFSKGKPSFEIQMFGNHRSRLFAGQPKTRIPEIGGLVDGVFCLGGLLPGSLEGSQRDITSIITFDLELFKIALEVGIKDDTVLEPFLVFVVFPALLYDVQGDIVKAVVGVGAREACGFPDLESNLDGQALEIVKSRRHLLVDREALVFSLLTLGLCRFSHGCCDLLDVLFCADSMTYLQADELRVVASKRGS